MFVTLNYTYSAFKNTIVGTISGNAKDWVFKVNVDSGTVYNDSYKVHLTGTSGSFNVRISTVGGAKNAEYSIELTSNDLVKYYTDSACTNLIENNIYNGNINSNTSSNVTIYYKASSSINDDAYIKVKGNIMEVAMMKNGYDFSTGGTEFWNNTYRPYIRTITFENDLSNLPSNCTEENLCWDISYSSSQKKKVYGYLTDSGYKDSTDSTKTLYNLYIVSETPIFAPADCSYIFSFVKYDNGESKTNLAQINFNNCFNTSNVTNMSCMFRACSSLISLDLSSFNTSNVTNMGDMFSFCSSLTSLDLSSFNTSNVTNMWNMLSFCSSLTSLDLSSFNTSQVTKMSDMFDGCKSLTSLDLSSFNTSNVTNMSGMFDGCKSLTSLDLSSFNTSNVTSMYYMFDRCSSLTGLDLSSFNTSQVTDMHFMFSDCSSLTSLDLSGFNTLNVTNMERMFYECSSLTSLDLSNFNTSNVTNMNYMFFYCSSLTSLDLSSFNTSQVTNKGEMFASCSSLTSLDLSGFNTSNVTNMRDMFADCSSLTSLDLSGFNTSNVTIMAYMFYNCPKLTTTINIMNANVTDYTGMFGSAATSSNAKITVNYIAAASTLVDNMIATKSSSSNVVKGTQI